MDNDANANHDLILFFSDYVMATTGITQKGSDGGEVPPDTIWRWPPDDLSLPINPTWVLKGARVEAIGVMLCESCVR